MRRGCHWRSALLLLLRGLLQCHPSSLVSSSCGGSCALHPSTAALSVPLPGRAQLYRKSQQVFPQEYRGYPWVPVPQHPDPSGHEREQVNGHQAEPWIDGLLPSRLEPRQRSGTQLRERHAWQQQQQHVTVKEHYTLHPKRNPHASLHLPQPGLQIQHIEQVNHHPQKPAAHLLLPSEWSHVIGSCQDEKQRGQAHRK